MKLEHGQPVLEVKEVGEAGAFSGYAAVFGSVDRGADLIARGAFAESLSDWKARGKRPKMLWQHDTREPIGVWTEMREDDYGLFVRGEFTAGVVRAAEARALLKHGALEGLSIGYVTLDADFDRDLGVRKLVKLRVEEVSIVTIPMHPGAGVNDVKSVDEIETLSDAEQYLREAGGLSRKDARDCVSRVKKIAQREAGDDQLSALLGSIRAARAGLPQP